MLAIWARWSPRPCSMEPQPLVADIRTERTGGTIAGPNESKLVIMIEARQFVDGAVARGYSFWAGVPCSFLTPLINYVIQDERLTYIGAASEGEAVAIAAGGYLAGRKSVVICQNSGLGNMVNPLTSLNDTFQIPTLLIVTHRGHTAHTDEPQHALMGAITK